MDRRAQVLIVESDAVERQTLARLLSGAGMEPSCAADGPDALRRFYSAPPDVVLLGLDLPQLDGWEVLRRIRQLRDAPVLILADRESEVCKVRALRAGADDYVARPFSRVEIVARVEALLRRARSEEAPELFADDSLRRTTLNPWPKPIRRPIAAPSPAPTSRPSARATWRR